MRAAEKVLPEFLFDFTMALLRLLAAGRTFADTGGVRRPKAWVVSMLQHETFSQTSK